MTQITEQAIQNMHRMAFEQAKNNHLNNAYERVWADDFNAEVFIAEEEGKRLCLFVKVFVSDAVHYDCVNLMRNPEMFDLWDSVDGEFIFSELDAMLMGYTECLQ